MHSTKLYALHGFLGRPSDWQGLLPYEPVECLDFLKKAPQEPFSEWAAQFNAGVQPNSVGLGYSLGGRLLLHAVLARPSLWRAAIFVSVHPGLQSAHERALRLRLDEEWAEKFERQEWVSLMEAWNAQQVFQGGSFSFLRPEKEFSRSSLAWALRQWSLGRQGDLRQSLQELDLPVLWSVGAEDQKYAGFAATVKLKHPQSEIWLIPGAGHRAPWQKPEIFAEKIMKFLNAQR